MLEVWIGIWMMMNECLGWILEYNRKGLVA